MTQTEAGVGNCATHERKGQEGMVWGVTSTADHAAFT